MAGKKKILIVEDNEDCRELLAILVKRLGYEVVEAAMGLAAIDQGCATHPDLILMDLGLPGITGDEATARLKANPSTRNIPVVINTAFNVGAHTNRALDAGAVEILHKPLELSTLQDVLRRYALTEHGTRGVVVELKTQRLRQSPILQGV